MSDESERKLYILQGAVGELLLALGTQPQSDRRLECARQKLLLALRGRDSDVDTDCGASHCDVVGSQRFGELLTEPQGAPQCSCDSPSPGLHDVACPLNPAPINR